MSAIEEIINELLTDILTDIIAQDAHDESVGNLELETGGDFLLENLGFILLE